MEVTFANEYLTGYVLAGGASSRMGQDKALLEVNGRVLVEAAVLKLREVCAEVAILRGGDPDPRRAAALECFARTVPDADARMGPVGGIQAALADAQTPWVMIAAVDQPFLPVELLQTWFAAALNSGAKASCMSLGPVVQPLPMLIQTALGSVVKECIYDGERKVRSVLDAALQRVGAPPLHTLPVEANATTLEWFRNLNYPADLLRREDGVSLRTKQAQEHLT